MNFIGVDIGTSVCKALIFDEKGEKIAHSQRRYDVNFMPFGGAELDSEEVILNCFEIIKECTDQVVGGSVIGLGISCQGEAFTAVDNEGKFLSNAMVTSDIRAEKYVKSWTDNFGAKKLYEITGQTAHPLFTLFKLMWLKDNKPDVWEKAHKFLCFEDLLQYRLGLDPAISWSLAGRTMLFDVRKHSWNPDIMAAIDLSPDKLAKPLPSGSIVGKINSVIGDELGLAKDAFVVTAGHDQPCAALGAGVTSPGLAIYTAGTVECITPAFSKPIFSGQLRQNNLCTYDHAVTGLYISLAYCLSGGNILKWFRDEFGFKEIEEAKRTNRDPYEVIISMMDTKPSNIMVLPYFVPGGTPYFDTHTKGAILGLSLSTKRSEFIRALLEGVALEMRLNLDILEKSGCRVETLRMVGGGAKSKALIQLKADVIGKKIIELDESEAGCLGGAVLACSAYIDIPVIELVKKWVKIVSEVHPSKENAEFYRNKFQKYKKLYHQIKDI